MFLSGRIKALVAVTTAAGLLLLGGCDNPSAMNESSPNIKHITQGEFGDEVTRCPEPVVVSFYATWCGPCRELAPLLDRVAGNYTAKIKFVKVNVDESPGLAQNYEVQAIPLVLMFKDGKLADRISGMPPEAELRAKLDALVAGN
jgi:thioredoxin 1